MLIVELNECCSKYAYCNTIQNTDKKLQERTPFIHSVNRKLYLQITKAGIVSLQMLLFLYRIPKVFQQNAVYHNH